MRFAIHRFESIASTNDLAGTMAEEGAPEGTVVIAGEQTAGRGRRGRSWSSPPGVGLYLSLVLRPDRPFDNLWQITFVAAVASAEAVRQVSRLPAQIKWPNDVLINSRKVCGILVEARKHLTDGKSQDPQPETVVVGIGINVNASEFPQEIAQKATSIALEVGHVVDMEQVEEALLGRLNEWHFRYLQDGFPPVLEAWKALDCTVGRRVVADTSDGMVEGTAIGINATGSLVVEREDGVGIIVSAGDVLPRDS